jgi:RNA polymerase sigma factor (sigma-70 family)
MNAQFELEALYDFTTLCESDGGRLARGVAEIAAMRTRASHPEPTAQNVVGVSGSITWPRSFPGECPQKMRRDQFTQEVIMSLSMPAVNSVDIEYSPMEISDEMLTSRAKSGDADAFVELSKRHASRVFQVTFRVTRNRQDAEDAFQDAFLNAFTHIKNFEGRSSFSTWLTRIAINSALMTLRKKRNCREIPIDGGDGGVGNVMIWEPQSPMDDPESHYVRGERHKRLRKAIYHLPPIYREVIQLQEAKERSLREIAQSLGITVSAVKSRLSRARSALRTSMI